jgi:4-carboxymuconolactone decarboxylase
MITPLEPPYAPEIEASLKKWMVPGAAVEPLALFRTLAKSPLLFDRMRPLGAGLLGKGTLPPGERETIILQTCRRCGCEYEWGVHKAAFARDLVPDELLVRACDELHDRGTLTDTTLDELHARYSDGQILEILALAGFYHLISFIANGARVPLEPWAERFSQVGSLPSSQAAEITGAPDRVVHAR